MAALLALDCPRCGAAVPALPADIAFVCVSCPAAFEVLNATLVHRELAQSWVPTSDATVRVNLPVWRFELRVSVDPSGTATDTVLAARRAQARVGQLGHAYVPAFSVHRPQVFGDWGLQWTAAQPAWQVASRVLPLVGAALSSDDAARLAEHYVLDRLDRVCDLENISVSVTPGRPLLLALPTAVEEARLRDPWLGDLLLPISALDDFTGIAESATVAPGALGATPRA
ncbi:MAG: hypothetical protein ACRELD_06925 [Longimicrobiales bacterium]